MFNICLNMYIRTYILKLYIYSVHNNAIIFSFPHNCFSANDVSYGLIHHVN